MVRRLIGYDRYNSVQALAHMNALYDDLRLYVNFFQPSMKLVAKRRVDTKVLKAYDAAQTPYQRVLRSSDVDDACKESLRRIYLDLNPVALQRQINAHLTALWNSAADGKISR